MPFTQGATCARTCAVPAMSTRVVERSVVERRNIAKKTNVMVWVVNCTMADGHLKYIKYSEAEKCWTVSSDHRKKIPW